MTTTPGDQVDEILAGINAHQDAEGLIECAIVSELEGGGYIAALYFDPAFRDSAQVAGWFHKLGAINVVIDHTLYSDIDGDRDGLTHDAQAWTVLFDLPDPAA